MLPAVRSPQALADDRPQVLDLERLLEARIRNTIKKLASVRREHASGQEDHAVCHRWCSAGQLGVNIHAGQIGQFSVCELTITMVPAPSTTTMASGAASRKRAWTTVVMMWRLSGCFLRRRRAKFRYKTSRVERDS